MRIEGPKGPDSVRKTEKTKKSSGASGSSFSSFLTDGADGPSAASGPASVAHVGGLLAVQSSEDPAERKARKRMMERADKVLDALSDVHRGLVTNTLSVADMKDVSRAVAAGREKVSDPVLAGLLDEVELRAAVELAKLELAAEKKR